MKVLCHHFWKVEPNFITLDTFDELKRCDAFLLIGNESLLHPKVARFTTIDLAHTWYTETNLPFTFAVFAARNDILKARPHDVEALGTAFQRAYSWALQHQNTVEALARKRLSIPLERIREYYKVLRYRFDDKQQLGLALYGQLIESLPKDSKTASSQAHVNVH